MYQDTQQSLHDHALVTLVFIALLVAVYFIYRYLYGFFKRKVNSTPGKLDDIFFDLFKFPVLWFLYWLLLKIFSHVYLYDLPVFPVVLHVNSLLLIFSLAWIFIRGIKAGGFYIKGKLNIESSDNLYARKSLTQINVFTGIAQSIIVFIAIAAALLTFKQAKTIGISLLTSAGIIGIIVGFAAQKTLGMILAGIQIALTQPVRLDDVVVVENEWGRIEEITLTYVVVKIWDERRLVLPVSYFLEKPFQNWTRTSAHIMGTVFLYLDFAFPVEIIRNQLSSIVEHNENWDGKVANVQVTNATSQFKEIRILVSSSDSSKNWDLRVDIREKIIDFINTHYPETFARIRVNLESEARIPKA